VLPWIRRRAVPIRAYDGASGEWLAVAPESRGPSPKSLVLTTFNVWFDEYHRELRHQAIADVVACHRPDVAVFQEVTEAARDVVLAQPWVRERYVSAELTGSYAGNYGMLLLSRHPIERVDYARLPTQAQRGVLRARLRLHGRSLDVGCVHLDSGKASVRLRNRQLNNVFRWTRRDPDVVLLGDFNMRDDENDRIRAPFVDVWPTLRPDDPGYTEDTTINLTRLDSTGKERHVRFDRVLLKGHGWRATDIELIGTEPVSEALPRVFPSDHFGVLCRIESVGFGGTGPGY
jgi:tyrosyl-DNA phosphodiesterase 2